MTAEPDCTSAESLAARQRNSAEALVARLDADGDARLDGSAASLQQLDAVLARARDSMDASARDRLAEQAGAYTGEVLLREMPGRWVLDDADLPAVELAGQARIRVTRRAQRLLRGEGDGMAALCARVSETVARVPPLGEDRPLGLRRSAFRYVDVESEREPSSSEAHVFRRVAAGAEQRTRSRGFGPSPFVWFLILCVVAVIAWAAYMYRNAPP